MSKHTEVSGKIVYLFAHRFVLMTADGPVLADVTPKGIEALMLAVGDEVSLVGEMKPSELKVEHLARGSATIAIDHKKKPHPDGHHRRLAPADPGLALKAARAAGYATEGEPRRKPKHFEVVARRDGALFELHIEFDGHIRKIKEEADKRDH